MNRILALLVVVFFATFSANAQAEGVWSADFSTATYTQRLSGTTGSVKYPDLLTQTTVVLGYAVDDVKLSMKVLDWTSWDNKTNGGDETDVYVWLDWAPSSALTVSAGYEYWFMPYAADLHVAFAKVNYRPAAKTSVFVLLEEMFPTRPEKLKGGLLYTFGVSQALDVCGQPFVLGAQVGSHHQALGLKSSPLNVGRVSASTKVGIVDTGLGKLSLDLGVAYQLPILGNCYSGGYFNAGLSLPLEFKK
ncbi:MAG: hypothetical protein HGA16_00280 [Candidatus Moranbacteria bacterium]|nr:hypothetical protein [Candidatus Moranbacteria bacterium]